MRVLKLLIVIIILLLGVVQANLEVEQSRKYNGRSNSGNNYYGGDQDDNEDYGYKNRLKGSNGKSSAFNHNHYKRSNGGHKIRNDNSNDQILGEFEYHHPKYQHHRRFSHHRNHRHHNGNNGNNGNNNNDNKYLGNNRLPGTPSDSTQAAIQHNQNRLRKEAMLRRRTIRASLHSCSMDCHRTHGSQLDKKQVCTQDCRTRFKLT